MLLAASLVATVLPGLSGAAVTPTSAMLAHPCLGCHGPRGNSIGAIPNIQGYPKEVIVSAMQGFRDGSRPQTIMGRIAASYSEQEINALGDYFNDLR